MYVPYFSRRFSPLVEHFLYLRVEGCQVSEPVWRAFRLDRPDCPVVFEHLLRAQLTELGGAKKAEQEAVVCSSGRGHMTYSEITPMSQYRAPVLDRMCGCDVTQVRRAWICEARCLGSSLSSLRALSCVFCGSLQTYPPSGRDILLQKAT